MPPSIQEHIRQRYPELSPALQDIARYLLDHPAEVVTSSMRHIGVQSGATPPTLVRFAQQVGFDGWPALKAAFAADLGLGGDAYGARAQHLVARAGESGGLTEEMFGVQRRNLEATQAQSGARLDKACALIEKAKAVHVAGFRASYPIAFGLVYQYRLFRPDVHLLDGQGGTLEMQLRAVGRGDVLVVTSFSPYSHEALQVAEAARDAGARIVALTDSLASPLSLLAQQTLLFSIHSPSFFPSVAAGLALAEALVELLASRAGGAAARAIGHAEQHLHSSGAYVRPPRGRPGT
ncbi:MurR/RpiR family transcriptional regulator [Paracidovorax cattleyae]|uniref:DNA-binding transcriptional regulator, MurR/RpiR family, contains HTH and SIS domains n=2 Tax=Paracidovorax cattleyae TaxID=80868 RepID=A0A1H0U7Q8_9BURK|nr:MurR/RpiR family transcriptional regulator [Paracidovorax cattleyae]SDP62199.1 DNA-binding transcriptional regulator, MurR/RpiR family, contains HTH and SIS domains [Paracidovorax cattleyae]